MSSPVLTTTVTSEGATVRTSPRSNFPAPIPPASAVTLIATQRSTLALHGRTRPPSPCVGRSREPSPGRRSRSARSPACWPPRATSSTDLCAVASRLREIGHGRIVTYSRKVFVPLTMLCLDHCHYCTFAKPPARLDSPYLTPEQVVVLAEAGRRLGCKEALFTLGDKPEERYPEARAWLAERGYRSTLEYVRAVAIKVIEETGLLPHLNPGVMSYEQLARLKHVARVDGADARDVLGAAVGA